MYVCMYVWLMTRAHFWESSILFVSVLDRALTIIEHARRRRRRILDNSPEEDGGSVLYLVPRTRKRRT